MCQVFLRIRKCVTRGSAGRHAQNIERDLHRHFGSPYGVSLEPYRIKIQVNNPDKGGVQDMWLPCYAPHEFFAELWAQGTKVFELACFGPGGPPEVAA